MKNKIKWKTLKKIIAKMSGKNIEIILSTEIQSSINAATNGKDIVINGNNIKSIEDTIKAIAHELVHIINKYDEGSEIFNNKWEEYRKFIIDKYINKI